MPLLAFYEEHKSKLWAVRFSFLEKKETTAEDKKPSYSIGLAIGDGLILTTVVHDSVTYHAIQGGDEYYKLNLILQSKKWNLTLLQFETKPSSFTPAQFADNWKLEAREELFFIGAGFRPTGVIVKVAFPSPENVTLPRFTDTNRRCNQYNPNSRELTPNFRLLGHIINVESIRAQTRDMKLLNIVPSKIFSSLGHLEPLIPLIQLDAMHDDGVIFKENGDVVGLVIYEADGCNFAIHVAVLKEFMNEGLKELESRSRNLRRSSGSSSGGGSSRKSRRK